MQQEKKEKKKKRDALPKKEERFESEKVYSLAQIMKTTKIMNFTEFISVNGIRWIPVDAWLFL